MVTRKDDVIIARGTADWSMKLCQSDTTGRPRARVLSPTN